MSLQCECQISFLERPTMSFMAADALSVATDIAKPKTAAFSGS